jgi:hypothetical protein
MVLHGAGGCLLDGDGFACPARAAGSRYGLHEGEVEMVNRSFAGMTAALALVAAVASEQAP